VVNNRKKKTKKTADQRGSYRTKRKVLVQAIQEAESIVDGSAFGQKMKIANSFLFLMRRGKYAEIKKAISNLVFNVRAPRNDMELETIIGAKQSKNALNLATSNTAHLSADYDQDHRLQFYVYHSYRISKEHSYLVGQVLHQMLHTAYAFHNIDINAGGGVDPDGMEDFMNNLSITAETPDGKRTSTTFKDLKYRKKKKA